MIKMNFPTLWCKWIMECVETALVLVNGSPTDEFKLERSSPRRSSFSNFFCFFYMRKG